VNVITTLNLLLSLFHAPVYGRREGEMKRERERERERVR
jgi:hypothetical protein